MIKAVIEKVKKAFAGTPPPQPVAAPIKVKKKFKSREEVREHYLPKINNPEITTDKRTALKQEYQQALKNVAHES